MTTKELFKKYSNYYQFEEGDSEKLIDKDDFEMALIEFAQFHVEVALIEARKRCFTEADDILHAYPLTNIK